MEEEIAAAGGDREIADFVDDEQRTAAEESDLLAQRPFVLGLGEGGDELGERDEVDAPAGADGLDGERCGEMGFAGAGPRRWMTSARLIKSRPASAMMRLRSSDGWNAKSKLARVLTMGSRAMRSAALIRRFSRNDSSSVRRSSIASIPSIWPCSMRRRVSEHLPREIVVHEPVIDCDLGACRRRSKIGEDFTEVLEKIPTHRHVRSKYACRGYERIFQAATPDLPIEKGTTVPASSATSPTTGLSTEFTVRRRLLRIEEAVCSYIDCGFRSEKVPDVTFGCLLYRTCTKSDSEPNRDPPYSNGQQAEPATLS